MKNNILYIMDRDIEVLKYLACGPAFAKDLHTRFFVKGGKPVHRRIFERRMKKLQGAGYLQLTRPTGIRREELQNNGRIYMTTEECLELLTNEGGVNVDRIRRVDLNKRSFPREMILTGLIRRICEFEDPTIRLPACMMTG